METLYFTTLIRGSVMELVAYYPDTEPYFSLFVPISNIDYIFCNELDSFGFVTKSGQRFISDSAFLEDKRFQTVYYQLRDQLKSYLLQIM